MGAIKAVQPVKVLIGFLGTDPDVVAAARASVARELGQSDLASTDWTFDSTQYYTAEMGPDLRKSFCTLAIPADPAGLADLKIATNRIETQLAGRDTGRRVNIDPGYVGLGKLVLATTKDHGHRIYLRDGIYAEVTLTYRNGAWQPWPWTFPDYATPRYHAFFNDARRRLREQLD